MEVVKTEIPDLIVIKPKVFGDARGYFLESWQQERYSRLGIPQRFVQDNVSRSSQNVLRGLHLQSPNPQGKLVYALSGEVFDVAVDIRRGSPTFGKWHGLVLSEDNHLQFYIPPGFAHGFCVLSETATFTYKCTDYYAPENEVTLRWDDPEVGIKWPIANPTLSAKDSQGLALRELPADRLVKF